MEKTSLTIEEIASAMANNDVERVDEMLDDFRVFKGGGASIHVSTSSMELISAMIRIATVKMWKRELNDDMANELIEHISPTVEIFNFIKPLVDPLMTANFNEIPTDIRDSLRENNFSKKIGKKIEALDKETFDKMLSYIVSSEVESLNMRFSLPIVRYCFVNELIPMDAFFPYMGITLNKPQGDVMLEKILQTIMGDSGEEGEDDGDGDASSNG